MPWPPTLQELKLDLGSAYDAASDPADPQLQQVLDAAVTFVERLRAGWFNFNADPLCDAPDPTSDLILGTLRLAGRWHTRRRSPDGLIAMAEMGSARVPAFDADIERLLRVGRHATPAVG